MKDLNYEMKLFFFSISYLYSCDESCHSDQANVFFCVFPDRASFWGEHFESRNKGIELEVNFELERTFCQTTLYIFEIKVVRDFRLKFVE